MDLIIYHNNCPDGWCAAYICKKKYPEAELVPLSHGLSIDELESLLERCRNKNVIMVDYSLPNRVLNDTLFFVANSLRILDHHKSAFEALRGASYATFDMKRSGAGLAWDYLFGVDNPGFVDIAGYGAPHRPWWVNYTEDQDLWNWERPNSKIINAFLMVQPRDEQTWDRLTKLTTPEVARLGIGVRSYIEYYTRSVVEEKQEGVLVFQGRNYRTAVLNIPYAGVSEAGNALVEAGYEIGLAWFERGDGTTQFSLRSLKDGDVDVSEIAKTHGGGGHQSAAGFQVSVSKGRQIVDSILGRE
jgi:oligoribonuclease NrnB/cAMP/cGMP phosphodiesterase (DHH superfamily)